MHHDQAIATVTQLPLKGVQAVIALQENGATVPFIARYRKDQTGGLDEVQIRQIIDEWTRLEELQARRESIFKSLGERLTPELEKSLSAATTKHQLEDLYLPYKPRRRTRAQKAREAGLEPLAQAMRYGHEQSPLAFARRFVKADIADVEAALAGARDILAEALAEHATVRDMARETLWRRGVLTAKAVGDTVDPRFQDYANFESAVRGMPSHRVLALQRGATEKALRLRVDGDADAFLRRVKGYLKVGKSPRRSRDWEEHLVQAIEDAWKRLLRPSLETEILNELKTEADVEAIRVFSRNVEALLMAAPYGGRSVMALDPGLRTGVKCVMLGETGTLQDHWVLHTLRDATAATALLAKKIKRYGPAAFAIGDGTGSREAEQFVRDVLKALQLEHPPQVIRVSETGASIYSASDLAREEFPDLDLTYRGAVSIGRRLQDPLAELVKIPPRSLGVGQYQHDVNQKLLQSQLEQSVESCVNRVGVELNTASVPLLKYVSGLNQRVAENIVNYRDAHGPFRSRTALKKVKGLGPKAFEQAAGFLRIHDAKDVLDRTAVHPEQYGVVKKIAQDLACSVAQLIEERERLQRLSVERYVSEHVGTLALQDIVEELQKPGRDPRDRFQAPQFAQHVNTLSDLKAGMVLEGRVTNITAFGAFVDIGVHQDGLVHISQLAEGFVKDPQDVVHPGQVIKVKVLDVDEKRRRIQLSARV